ncbi:hypothetical protein [uncultured Piscinibacter sp.]|uniref:hypothetical protein n=1 Tax=uncultured Piscinibacter sp. TaxID=1131835 RepID=UPI0026180C4A|nr:hypothetical protein [uncultured Piscinibacter sp.]
MRISGAFLKQRALTVLWPAFLMAGVLEMLVFVVVDPGDLHWFGGEALNWSHQAVYTVTFLIFWGVIAIAGALTALLDTSADDINADRGRDWPR